MHEKNDVSDEELIARFEAKRREISRKERIAAWSWTPTFQAIRAGGKLLPNGFVVLNGSKRDG